MDEEFIKNTLNENAWSYESRPLRNLEELLSWEPSVEENELLNLCPELEPSVIEEGPRVLLCHDMKGGYLEDRFARGCDRMDAFSFSRWSQIDIFNYFSHELVTIPPLTWVAAAHRNGVPVLGTFITEGTAGDALCQKILDSMSIVTQVAKKLVEISKFYKFEGWLINIENVIQPEKVEMLVQFLGLLTFLSHEQIPGSKVIWYDSVVSPTGKLDWQNELNAKNECFFQQCDGIYLNYCWNHNHLKETETLANACGRHYDVFVGVDVFGRGCFGGGGMNTNAALKLIMTYKLSIAIFAPGWVHEVLGSEKFFENESSFWLTLSLNVRRRLSRLPIETNFCPGFGEKYFESGRAVGVKPWCNLLFQSLQPMFKNDTVSTTCSAFNGGGCVLLTSSEHNLFRCHIQVPQDGCAIAIKVKNCADGASLEHENPSVDIVMSTERGEVTISSSSSIGKDGTDTDIEKVWNTETYGEKGWLTYYYRVDNGIGLIEQIGLRIRPPTIKLLLGHFKMWALQ